ncbi:MAG TPA: response regulator transcription factor [Terracidiphilus sp.]
MIRVLIVARSPFTQAGLHAAICADPRFDIVGKPSLTAGAEPGLAGVQEDVILFDGLEGDIDEFLSGAFKERRSRRVVLLAGELTRAEAVRLMQSGVQAILPRDSSASEIASALEAANEGLATFSPDFLRLLLPAPLEGGEQELEYLVDPLTARETEVLALLAGGAGNKLIAAQLRISEHTAKFHVSSILSKLGATTRAEAVGRGYRLGLILI